MTNHEKILVTLPCADHGRKGRICKMAVVILDDWRVEHERAKEKPFIGGRNHCQPD